MMKRFLLISLTAHLAVLSAAQVMPRWLGLRWGAEPVIEVGFIPVRHGRSVVESPRPRGVQVSEAEKAPAIREAASELGSSLSEPREDPKTISLISPEAMKWFASIRRRLEALKTYPSEAAAQRLEGESVVEVLILADGSVEMATLVKSSGHPVLDEAALKLVRGAGAFPVPPLSVKQEPGILLRCPVKYQLNR